MTIRVEVVQALPRVCHRVELELADGATAAEAVRAALARDDFGACDPDASKLAVFGRVVEPTRALRDGDRVECLRDLVVDPKERRRDRAGA